MKTFYKYFFLGIFLIGINSCCSKVGCFSVQNQPKIYLEFTGYQLEYNELSRIIPYLYSNLDDSLIDSSSYSYPTNYSAYQNSNLLTYITKSDVFFEMDFLNSLKESYIVIKTNVSSDTISEINFLVDQNKSSCNSCGKKEDSYTIQNFSFYHKGIQYFDGDTVNISK